MRCRVVVITSAQHGLITPELRICAGSKPARGSKSEICYRENIWQWFRPEIMRKRYLSGNHSPLLPKTKYQFNQVSSKSLIHDVQPGFFSNMFYIK